MSSSTPPEPLLIEDGRVEAISFPRHPVHNSIWAIAAGDDGKIYPGLCCEIEAPLSAVLYQYDPKTRTTRFIYDIPSGRLRIHDPVGDTIPFGAFHDRWGNY